MSSVGEIVPIGELKLREESPSGYVSAFGQEVEVHNFLFLANGYPNTYLIKTAVPQLRESLAGKPETAAMLKKNELVDSSKLKLGRDIYYEFAGTWRCPEEIYDAGKQSEVRFINPNHVHAHYYSDIFVECPCDGDSLVKRSIENRNTSDVINGEHINCKPYHRLNARAMLGWKREQTIIRCITLGWNGTDIAPRLGLKSKNVGRQGIGSFMESYGHSTDLLKSNFRRLAGNTYTVLVHEYGVPAEKVAKCYGLSRPSMYRYSVDYGDLSDAV